jgi:hypothetical protein
MSLRHCASGPAHLGRLSGRPTRHGVGQLVDRETIRRGQANIANLMAITSAYQRQLKDTGAPVRRSSPGPANLAPGLPISSDVTGFTGMKDAVTIGVDAKNSSKVLIGMVQRTCRRAVPVTAKAALRLTFQVRLPLPLPPGPVSPTQTCLCHRFRLVVRLSGCQTGPRC